MQIILLSILRPFLFRGCVIVTRSRGVSSVNFGGFLFSENLNTPAHLHYKLHNNFSPLEVNPYNNLT